MITPRRLFSFTTRGTMSIPTANVAIVPSAAKSGSAPPSEPSARMMLRASDVGRNTRNTSLLQPLTV